MKVTFLGHAGFCVETNDAVVVMDPWLSSHGAFDSAWFQYPRNHHLSTLVEEKLSDPTRRRYVYISHEHGDHFDLAFLQSLTTRDFTLLLPNYRRDALPRALSEYQCEEILVCENEERIDIPGGWVRLFLDDSELNRDSAILLVADGFSFLNLNDCNLRDALPRIARDYGPIDCFTCQFSGATWHPTCYEYDTDQYESISRQKVAAKFRAVLQSIRHVNPRVFVPSAGPPCFLDPMLFHLNSEPVNIFPSSDQFLEYARQRLSANDVELCGMSPGDVLDAAQGSLVHVAAGKVSDDDRMDYLRAYAQDYADTFEERDRVALNVAPDVVLEGLADTLQLKLKVLELGDAIDVPLYVGLLNYESPLIRVDFETRVASEVAGVIDDRFYELRVHPWQARRMLEGVLTWEELALTFRVRLRRRPDNYSQELHGFLLMEPPDLPPFYAKLRDLSARTDRIEIEAGERRFSILRSCPHQGGALDVGWCEDGHVWICPRHGWRFDLDDGGRCTTSRDASIEAVRVD